MKGWKWKLQKLLVVVVAQDGEHQVQQLIDERLKKKKLQKFWVLMIVRVWGTASQKF